MAEGGRFVAANTTIGKILRLDLLSKGRNYSYANLDFTQSGDGYATGTTNVNIGVITYPGRYLNDDGFISSYNFLQDRDYYQNHSYVIKLKKSIDEYRSILKEYLHPSGMKMWGEYQVENDYHDYEPNTITSGDSTEILFKLGSYQALDGVVTISLTNHGQSEGDNVYIEFISGNVATSAADAEANKGNIANGLFVVTENIDVNTFNVVHHYSQANTSGDSYIGLNVT